MSAARLAAICAAARHYTKRQIQAQYPCSDATFNRKIRPRTSANPWGGQLPEPCGCVGPGGCNLFPADKVDAALVALRSQPRREFPRGMEDAGRNHGHKLRDEFGELKAAAADSLNLAGIEATGKVLSRFTRTGRLGDIPLEKRRDAIRELRRLMVTTCPGN